MRHGETDWNRESRIQGHSDIPLNEAGRRQLDQLAVRLSDTSFSAIYASDLSRTLESARLVAGTMDLPVEAVKELREFSYGEWEGLTLSEIEARDPEGFTERMVMRNERFAAPGGENTYAMLERVRRFHERTIQRHEPGDEILVVAHGGSIRALAVCLLNLSVEHFWRFRIDTASLSVIRTAPSGGVLERWNDTSHLATGSRQSA